MTMNTLILDKFAEQPLYIRSTLRSLTALAWCFWIYLWSPLIMSGAIYLGFTHGVSSDSVRMLQVLTTTLGDHFTMVCIAISIFIAWALIQHVGKGQCRHTASQDWIESIHTTQTPVLAESTCSLLRDTQRMIVFHNEQSGQIIDFIINGDQPKCAIASSELLRGVEIPQYIFSYTQTPGR
jgi:poly-beta-1,6-N-acetyl-D-glucosamine biosynthesis protein PgaD